MLTLLFGVLLCVMLAEFIAVAFKMAWGLAKIIGAIVFFPIALVVLTYSGFVVLSIIAVLIGGLYVLLTSWLFR